MAGGFYRTLEWLLKWRTDLFLFESTYVAGLFRAEIGRPPAMVRVVHNGVSDAEFAPIATNADATDLVCLGELRPVKAFDVLIEALARMKASGRRVSATIAGEGPQSADLRALAQRLDIADLVRFVGYRPAREAFAMGRMLVIPSRAESLPYVVLEAIAAGLPVIATRVGGVPEIFGPQTKHLIAPDNIGVLVSAITAAIEAPGEVRRVMQQVKSRVHREFSMTAMVDGGLAAYREAIALRKLAQFT
jgi:glycosyltransferase involved in cell wall biosynthesis